MAASTKKKLTVLLDSFESRSPAQHLVDRLLIGYPSAGAWQDPGFDNITVHAAEEVWKEETGLKRRQVECNLNREDKPTNALQDADAVLIVPGGAGVTANEAAIEAAIEITPDNTPIFVHGALANSLQDARRLAGLAAKRSKPLAAGTSLSVAGRLPDIGIPLNAPMKEALVVVQGSFGAGEFAGINSLLPLVERRAGGESGIKRVYRYHGAILWGVARSGRWPRHLLSPSLSRSDSPQGDPVKDGRTQDLVGLGLVEKLASDPRGWVIEHRDGFRSTILTLDGAVADFNFAIEMKDGSVLSAQIYQPPKPNEENYSRLAAVIERFFSSGRPPWPVERSLLTAHLQSLFLNLSLLGGSVTDVSALKPAIAYRPTPTE